MFDSIINKVLSLDPELVEKLAVYKGRVIAIDVQGYNKTLYIFPHENGLQITTDYTGEVDTTLFGTPGALMKMTLQKDVAPMLLRGEVDITGDLKLGRGFKKTLSEMQIDWEEHASVLLGDTAAHHLVRTLSALAGWGRRTSTSFKDDVSDYLQEESRDVISAAELESFYEEVDQLRDSVERLQARINAVTK